MTHGQYPKYLEETLKNRFQDKNFRVIDAGRAGTDSNYVAESIEHFMDKYIPEAVIVMTGYNDGRETIPYGEFVVDKQPFLRTFRLINFIIYHFRNTLPAIREARADELSISTDSDIFIYKQLNKARFLIGSYTEVIEGIEILENLARDFPDNHEVHLNIISLNGTLGRIERAKKAFDKLNTISPNDPNVFFHLAAAYSETLDTMRRHQSPYTSIIEDARAFVNENFDSIAEGGYPDELARILITFKEYEKAEKVVSKALKENPESPVLIRQLAFISERLEKHEESRSYFEKLSALEETLYTLPETIRNFHQIKHMVKSRGVTLIFMSYPRRSVEPIKYLFKDRTGIIFIDNTEVFDQAVEKYGYWKVFKDIFGDNFGHMTPFGCQIMAEHIAEALELHKVIDFASANYENP